MSIGSSGNGAAGAPLELLLVAGPPTAGAVALGLVTGLGGVTVVPAPEIVSPVDTGPTETPAPDDAGAEPAVGVAGGALVNGVAGVLAGAGTVG